MHPESPTTPILQDWLTDQIKKTHEELSNADLSKIKIVALKTWMAALMHVKENGPCQDATTIPPAVFQKVVKALEFLNRMAANSKDLIPGFSTASDLCDAQAFKLTVLEETTEALAAAKPYLNTQNDEYIHR